jgi:uncharacterized iron-regulated membrane protein
MVSRGAHFARINWDLHSALGFWCFAFVLLWGVSGIYFSFPRWFDALDILDPADRFKDQGLYLLSQLHFGRFGWFTKVVWAVLGLAPAVLAFTGTFICCRKGYLQEALQPVSVILVRNAGDTHHICTAPHCTFTVGPSYAIMDRAA